jgi:hypothetical protein
MRRCKYIHTLVFIQFRRILPDAKLHDLKEIFKVRKNFLLRELERAEDEVEKEISFKRKPNNLESEKVNDAL